MYLSIRRAMKQIVVIIGAYHFYQLGAKFYPTFCCQRTLLEIISVDFDATGQLLIVYSAFVKYLGKNGTTMKKFISSL